MDILSYLLAILTQDILTLDNIIQDIFNKNIMDVCICTVITKCIIIILVGILLYVYDLHYSTDFNYDVEQIISSTGMMDNFHIKEHYGDNC